MRKKPRAHKLVGWFDQVVQGLANSVDVHADLTKGVLANAKLSHFQPLCRRASEPGDRTPNPHTR